LFFDTTLRCRGMVAGVVEFRRGYFEAMGSDFVIELPDLVPYGDSFSTTRQAGFLFRQYEKLVGSVFPFRKQKTVGRMGHRLRLMSPFGILRKRFGTIDPEATGRSTTCYPAGRHIGNVPACSLRLGDFTGRRRAATSSGRAISDLQSRFLRVCALSAIVSESFGF